MFAVDAARRLGNARSGRRREKGRFVKLSFTRFRDLIWAPVDWGTKSLATAPGWVQAAGYGTVRGILWAAYLAPGTPLRATARAFARVADVPSPHALYGGFARRFTLALQRMEMMRLGNTGPLDALLQIPDQPRLEALLAEGKGALILMPHCHASVVTVRALAARYPVLMLMREPADDYRAETQRPYYHHIGCELLEVRRSPETVVARAVLQALKKGKIVVGIVDRIKTPTGKKAAKGDVRALAFGQTADFVGWPARFAARCEAPLLPAMVEQTETAVTLHLGEAVAAADPEATQKWVTGLEALLRRYPYDWGFVYDKHWSRLLRRATSARGA